MLKQNLVIAIRHLSRQKLNTSLLIATPLSWYGINQWLQNYAYQTEINWWVFGLTALTVIVIALVTVSSQAFKAAISNPVESLRSE